MKNIAIIPARCGSKGLKDKNILDLNGKPMMAWTIEAAIKSKEFDEVMVSTDSEKYAAIAIKYGAKVPFLRSAETATDKASSWDVVLEVLKAYEKEDKKYDTFCLLQPTSPLRTEKDIQRAYSIFYEKANFAVVSVCEAEHSPLWCGHLSENNELSEFIDAQSMKQRQADRKFYRLNGAIYIVKCECFLEDRYLYQKGSFAYIMPQVRSIDIDSLNDFRLAEIVLAEYEKGCQPAKNKGFLG